MALQAALIATVSSTYWAAIGNAISKTNQAALKHTIWPTFWPATRDTDQSANRRAYKRTQDSTLCESLACSFVPAYSSSVACTIRPAYKAAPEQTNESTIYTTDK